MLMAWAPDSAPVPQQTRRFTVQLNDNVACVVSFKKLVKDAEAEEKAEEVGAPSGANPALEARLGPTPALPTEASAQAKQATAATDALPAPPNRFSSVIERIERLYAGAGSDDEKAAVADEGASSGYDTDDSFIDDDDLDVEAPVREDPPTRKRKKAVAHAAEGADAAEGAGAAGGGGLKGAKIKGPKKKLKPGPGAGTKKGAAKLHSSAKLGGVPGATPPSREPPGVAARGLPPGPGAAPSSAARVAEGASKGSLPATATGATDALTGDIPVAHSPALALKLRPAGGNGSASAGAGADAGQAGLTPPGSRLPGGTRPGVDSRAQAAGDSEDGMREAEAETEAQEPRAAAAVKEQKNSFGVERASVHVSAPGAGAGGQRALQGLAAPQGKSEQQQLQSGAAAAAAPAAEAGPGSQAAAAAAALGGRGAGSSPVSTEGEAGTGTGAAAAAAPALARKQLQQQQQHKNKAEVGKLAERALQELHDLVGTTCSRHSWSPVNVRMYAVSRRTKTGCKRWRERVTCVRGRCTGDDGVGRWGGRRGASKQKHLKEMVARSVSHQEARQQQLAAGKQQLSSLLLYAIQNGGGENVPSAASHASHAEAGGAAATAATAPLPHTFRWDTRTEDQLFTVCEHYLQDSDEHKGQQSRKLYQEDERRNGAGPGAGGGAGGGGPAAAAAAGGGGGGGSIAAAGKAKKASRRPEEPGDSNSGKLGRKKKAKLEGEGGGGGEGGSEGESKVAKKKKSTLLRMKPGKKPGSGVSSLKKKLLVKPPKKVRRRSSLSLEPLPAGPSPPSTAPSQGHQEAAAAAAAAPAPAPAPGEVLQDLPAPQAASYEDVIN
eukprot:jgi/Mesen1/3129/ME000184S02196